MARLLEDGPNEVRIKLNDKVVLFYLFIRVCSHSVLKLFTGFAVEAFIAWKLTVNSVIITDPTAAIAKTHHEISVRYS